LEMGRQMKGLLARISQCAVEAQDFSGEVENPPGNFRSAGSSRSSPAWQRTGLKPPVQKVSKGDQRADRP